MGLERFPDIVTASLDGAVSHLPQDRRFPDSAAAPACGRVRGVPPTPTPWAISPPGMRKGVSDRASREAQAHQRGRAAAQRRAGRAADHGGGARAYGDLAGQCALVGGAAGSRARRLGRPRGDCGRESPHHCALRFSRKFSLEAEEGRLAWRLGCQGRARGGWCAALFGPPPSWPFRSIGMSSTPASVPSAEPHRAFAAMERRFELRAVLPHPAVNRRVVEGHASFLPRLFHIAMAQGAGHVSTHTDKDLASAR
jgi:hypothetical protein